MPKNVLKMKQRDERDTTTAVFDMNPVVRKCVIFVLAKIYVYVYSNL